MHVLDAGSQPVEQERLSAGEADGEEQRDAIRARPGTSPARTAPSDTSRCSPGVPTSTFGGS